MTDFKFDPILGRSRETDDASEIENDSSVTGANVKDALNALYYGTKNTVAVTRTNTRIPKITKIETLMYTLDITLDPNGNRPLSFTNGIDTWTPTRVRAGGSVVSVA